MSEVVGVFHVSVGVLVALTVALIVAALLGILVSSQHYAKLPHGIAHFPVIGHLRFFKPIDSKSYAQACDG